VVVAVVFHVGIERALTVRVRVPLLLHETRGTAFPTHHTPPLRLPILVPEGTSYL
jgi:hypothetical protein